jgi:hypothetical protein
MFFSRPAPLTNLQIPSAVELAAKADLSPAARALARPGQSAGEFLQALEKNKLPLDAMKGLSHGLSERQAVLMACLSALKVAEKLNPEEVVALRAAEAWVKNPTEATKAAAAAAAAKTDFRGPGGWAAQAAAWSKGSAPAAPNPPAAPPLAPAAVGGAVLLAAGLVGRPPMPAPQKPQLAAAPVPPSPVKQPEMPPVDQGKMVKLLQPFLNVGKEIAAGKIA